MKKPKKQRINHKVLLGIVIAISILLGASAGLYYKSTHEKQGLELSVTNYSITAAQPANPSIDTSTQSAHVITVQITNKSGANFVLLPTEYFQLVVDGVAYTLSPDLGVTNPLAGGEITQGSVVSGQLSFHIPVGSGQGEVQFRSSINAPWVTIPQK